MPCRRMPTSPEVPNDGNKTEVPPNVPNDANETNKTEVPPNDANDANKTEVPNNKPDGNKPEVPNNANDAELKQSPWKRRKANQAATAVFQGSGMREMGSFILPLNTI